MLSGVLTAFKLISQNLTNQPQALHLTRSFPLAAPCPALFHIQSHMDISVPTTLWKMSVGLDAAYPDVLLLQG